MLAIKQFLMCLRIDDAKVLHQTIFAIIKLGNISRHLVRR